MSCTFLWIQDENIQEGRMKEKHIIIEMRALGVIGTPALNDVAIRPIQITTNKEYSLVLEYEKAKHLKIGDTIEIEVGS